MGFDKEFIEKILSATSESFEDIFDKAINELKNKFSNLKQDIEVRFFTIGSPHFGHQASTLHLLERFIECFDTSHITITYYYGESEYAIYRTMIAGLPDDPNPAGSDVTLFGKIITFKLQPSGAEPIDEAFLGLNGGIDKSGDDLKRAVAQMNVKFCLALQPYAWDAEAEAGYSDSGFLYKNGVEYTLIPISRIFGGNKNNVFSNQAFFFSSNVFDIYDTSKDWFLNNPPPPLTKEAMSALNEIIKNNTNLHVWPVYGLQQVYGLLRSFFNLVVSSIIVEYTRKSAPKNVVIPVLCEVNGDDKSFADILLLITSVIKRSPDEELNKFCEGILPYCKIDDLKKIIEKIDELKVPFKVADHIFIKKIENISDTLITEITTPPASLEEMNIYILYFTKAPRPFMNKLFEISDYPALFEGQGTASMAFSTGRPFLKFNSMIGINAYRYGDFIALEVADQLLNMAKEFVSEIKIETIDGVVSFILNPPDAFQSYLAYLSLPKHDKFLVGIACAADQMSGALPQASHALREEDVPTLDEIYNRLDGCIRDQTDIDLCALFPESRLAEFYKALTDDMVFPKTSTLSKETDEAGEITRVILHADAFSFLEADFSADMAFYREFDSLTSEFKAVFAGSLKLPALSWVELKDPGFAITIAEEMFRVAGGISTRVDAGSIGVDVSIALEDVDTWTIQGKFDAPCSPADVFKLCGGFNFTTAFAPFFDAVDGVGVSDVSFTYNNKESVLELIELTLTTKNEWVIVEQPEFSIVPSVKISIYHPGSIQERRAVFGVTGEFKIGEARVAVNGQYPDFLFRAELTEGAINFGDLAEMIDPKYVIPALKDFGITQFSLEVRPDEQLFDIRCLIENKSWVAADAFTITGLSFNVNKVKRDLSLAIGGGFRLLPGSPDKPLSVAVEAAYKTAGGWIITGAVSIGKEISVVDLINQYDQQKALATTGDEPNLPLAELKATIETQTGDWRFSASMAEKWQVPFIDETELDASLDLSKKTVSGVSQYEARLNAEVEWRGVTLGVWYSYNKDQKSFGITWESLTAEVVSESGAWKAHIKLTEGTTLGSVVSRMLRWFGASGGLTAPWNILNAIKLDGLSLDYNFTTGEIGLKLTIEPKDLGFAKIEGVALTYESGGENKGVFITLEGSFFWQKNPSEPLKWDASKPETAPSPGGSGNNYFRLDLLALGQYISLPDLAEASTVEAAVSAVKELAPPTDKKLPGIVFSKNSSWLFASEFQILKLEGKDESGYMIGVQAVFNDPNLYALRVRLQGAAAKVFKGLDIQVLYRRINDTVGVFQAQITLPDTMRCLTIGAYSLTLPVFGIAVYTNGDFQVDIGFPWNRDFSRSLSVEGIIPPGIPLLGSAGVYFGKLSNDTAGDLVPSASTGLFNPVTVFGFGIQAGFGKSVHYGPLNAGFSITLLCIIEGVLAKWNPYQGDGTDTDVYYYKLSGTAGISGNLFGCVDFAIIKVDVNVSLQIMVNFTFEYARSSVVTVLASVTVKAGITINLFFVKIHISFSFALNIKETFAIGDDTPAPWDEITMDSRRGVLRSPLRRRLTKAVRNPEPPHWDKLKASDTKGLLHGWLAATPLLAGDEWENEKAVPCLVLILLLKDTDDSFVSLGKMAGRWIAAALQTGSDAYTPERADELVVTKGQLESLISDYLECGDDDLMPLKSADIDAFMNGQFVFTIPQDADKYENGGEADGVYFPMPGGVSVDMGCPNGNSDPLSYDFSNYNAVSGTKLKALRSLFNQLAVTVDDETGKDRENVSAGEDESLSMAEWVYADYFLFIVRHIAQSMRDRLRNYQYILGENETVDSVLTWIQENGGAAYEPYDVFAANGDHSLTTGKTLALPGGVFHTVQEGETLNSISQSLFIPMQEIAEIAENSAVAGLFDGKEPLDLPHLEQLRTRELISTTHKTAMYSTLAGMVSRYALHGLRIPADGITPNVDGMWVRDKKLPPAAGLYALTGQQAAVPDSFENTFSVQLESALAWLVFEGGAYILTIEKDSDMARFIGYLASAKDDPSWLAPVDLSYLSMLVKSPAAYTFANPLAFNPDAPLPLPYPPTEGRGAKNADVPALSILSIPAGMSTPRDSVEKRRYALKAGVYDEASGAMKSAAAPAYGFASLVKLRVRKLADAKSAAVPESVYEIAGIGGTDQAILEDMLSSAVSVERMAIGYTPQNTNNLQSSLDADFFVLRSNLSTDSNPPNLLHARRLNGEDDCLEFIRLLWEAGVANSGGYYLYYSVKTKADAVPFEGLPDAAFNDEGMAELSVIVIHSKEVEETTQNTVYSYMNRLIAERLVDQNVILYGESISGEYDRQPSMPPGAVLVGQSRPAMEDPEEVVDRETAGAYLANRYSLLGYRIQDNGPFGMSPFALPAGPNDASHEDSGDPSWDYRIALPYARFYQGGAYNPYAAAGYDLSILGWWQDIYGNKFKTQDASFLLKTGYSDILQGVSAWPSVSVCYRIAGGENSVVYRLQFSFDTSPYENNGKNNQSAANAARDLKKYTQILFQLNDPNGIDFRLNSTLFDAGSITWNEDQKNEIMAWLESGDSSVKTYLEARAKGESGDIKTLCEIDFEIGGVTLNTTQLYALSSGITVSRRKKDLLPGFEEVSGALLASTSVPPTLSTEKSGASQSLLGFALDFEQALPGNRLMVDSETKDIWVLKQGGPDGIGFNFSPDDPALFAFRPLYTTLKSSLNPVPIYGFDKESGLSVKPIKYKQYTAVDMEIWLKRITSALEESLVHDRIGWIKSLDMIIDTTYLDTLLDIKKKMAGALKDLLVPLLEEQKTVPPEAAREAAYQILLKKLTSFYEVHGIAQKDVEVQNSVDDGDTPPNIYGSNIEIKGGANIPVTLTSSRFPIKKDKPTSMIFSVIAPEIVKDDNGNIIDKITMEAQFHGTHIEHNIHMLPNIENYNASSWLSFITQPPDDPFVKPLGGFTLPLLLRGYPVNPVLETQRYLNAVPPGNKEKNSSLEELLKWDYIFVYSLPIFYPQDTVRCFIRFNEAVSRRGGANKDDDSLFIAFAQFIETYPSVEEAMQSFDGEINMYLKRDDKKVTEADNTLTAMQTLSKNVTEAMNQNAPRKMASYDDALTFTVKEGSATINEKKAFTVCVTVDSIPSGRGDIPVVYVLPEYYEVKTLSSETEAKTYYYINKKNGEVLSPAEGQKAKDRTVQLEKLNLMSTQNARSGLHIDRNRGILEKEINNDFVYTTGDVQFETACFAAQDIGDDFDICSVRPVQTPCPMDGILFDFFKALFASVSEETCFSLQAEILYERPIHADISFISIPVFMQIRSSFDICDLMNALCKPWKDKTMEWCKTYLPKGMWDQDALFRIDMTIFSSLTPEPMQMLRMRRLVLPCKNIK